MSRESANRNRIFIGRLNPEARVKDVEAFFKDNGFARLKDVNVKLGYAFVEFDDKRDADDAVYELDRKEFFGSRIVVELAKRGPRIHDDRERDGYRDGRAARGRPYNTEWRVIVTNLSSRVGWMDLKDYFRAAGEVTFTKANKERMGEGVVEFKSYREMKRAVKRFDGTEFFDRRIKCIDDSPGPPRDYSGSRSRSRSNHRSRSRSRSRRRSRSRSPRRSRSRSRSKSRTPRSKSRSPRRSRSKSPQKSRSRTPPPQEEDKAAE